jgi:hypothetical protein
MSTFKRSWTVMALALSAVLLGTSACGGPGDASGLLQPTQIEGSRASASGLRKLERAGDRARVVVERIGPEGGVIETAGHRLTVPAGAVEEPVVFRMRVVDGAVEVDLTATGRQSKTENDVGAAGFDRPLGLELSYSEAAAVADPGQLVIVWVRDDGTLVSLPSTVDRGARTVSAKLNHFSAYALAMPN